MPEHRTDPASKELRRARAGLGWLLHTRRGRVRGSACGSLGCARGSRARRVLLRAEPHGLGLPAPRRALRTRRRHRSHRRRDRKRSRGRSTATRRTTCATSPRRQPAARPFRQRWSRNEGALLEFPPVIYGERIFQLADDGVLAAIDKTTGPFRLGAQARGRSRPRRPQSPRRPSTPRSSRATRAEKPARAVALNVANGRVDLVAQPAEPERVLAARRLAGRCSSAHRTEPFTRSTRAPGRPSGPTTRKAQ